MLGGGGGGALGEPNPALAAAARELASNELPTEGQVQRQSWAESVVSCQDATAKRAGASQRRREPIAHAPCAAESATNGVSDS